MLLNRSAVREPLVVVLLLLAEEGAAARGWGQDAEHWLSQHQDLHWINEEKE